MKQLEPTERDAALLSLLARGCILRFDQVRLIYGVAKYHYKRLTVLEERGYVLCRRRYVQVTRKGLAVLGLHGRPLDVRHDWQREYRARVAEVYFALKISACSQVRSRAAVRRQSRNRLIACFVTTTRKGNTSVFKKKSDLQTQAAQAGVRIRCPQKTKPAAGAGRGHARAPMGDLPRRSENAREGLE